MPNIYSVPFMITKTYVIHGGIVRIILDTIADLGKNNFERFTIYPTLTLISNGRVNISANEGDKFKG
jgi:hypothetical protein